MGIEYDNDNCKQSFRLKGYELSKVTDNKTPTTIDGESMELIPSPIKIDLKTIDDVRLEMARVYRQMKSGQIETSDGTKLVYVLSAIGKMIEVHDIEKRIELLEAGETGGQRKLEPLKDDDFLG